MAHDGIHAPATAGMADQKDIKSPPANDTNDRTVIPVNWLEHWTKHEDGTPKTIPYPQGLGPGEGQKQQFENIIISYLNSWLDLWNAYQPQGGDPKRTLRNQVVFEYIPADADVPGSVRISGRTNPEAELMDEIPDAPNRGRTGGGHLIPPEPPPPPPGSDLG